MQLTSVIFFALVFLVFVALRLCNRFAKTAEKQVFWAKIVLLAASYLFVGYANWFYAVCLAALTLICWYCAGKKHGVLLGSVAALGALAYFKYTNFLLDSLQQLLGKEPELALQILLPLGISFYSFSAIGYLLDVKRGKLQRQGLLDVSLYLAFFPKFTSGPIQKAGAFFEQMNQPNRAGWVSFSTGIQIFCLGLFKKLVLADRLAVFVGQVFDTPAAFSGLTVLLAVVSYALQIYLDFSGYSDMAIGIARILGYELPQNFNLPYLAQNVTEFWKRWHISLSQWLQEYLYISLGGNRKGKLRSYCNLILTMVLGGLWHGAGVNYLLWGLLHGLALVVHKLWMQLRRGRTPTTLGRIVSTGLTFLFVSCCWIFFRAASFDSAMVIFQQIFTMQSGITHLYFWSFLAMALVLIATVIAAVRAKKQNLQPVKANMSRVESFYPLLDLTKFWHLVAFFVLLGLIAGLAYTGGSPFIYGAY